ncbi:hypothetical protein ASE12_01910 [Aeromicrobium sp. Root236]|uniref:DUF4393 domain-containing protein n=1 Tax=Aeromicrobium sp. Root236 TaxID=1736498 RepID=UPI0006F3FB82|nr:DUF4393 domain-containing protein [Aeromicrobium sp. Root236]KRC63626.1 hypothetical protein ASE12_01910 [Aeromicrobium sp. Root236]
MTGAEIVPAAAKAAAKAAKGDRHTGEQLTEIAKESPHFKAAANSLAKRQEVKQALLLKLYSPLGKLVGLSKDYFEHEFAADMARKLDGIPDEELISPKPSVAGPAMEGLRYSLDEPTLKDMYLELLATATDRRVEGKAHPSFAEIIRQLSGEEAALLKALISNEAPVSAIIPIANIIHELGPSGHNVLATHVLDLRAGDIPIVEPSLSVWVDNWVRLGLVEVDFQTQLTDATAYDWVKTRPEFLRFGQMDLPEGHEIGFSRGIMRRRDFGTQFMAAVVA